ncbi:MAG: hypothetical protein AVDCRST_MAG19-4032, partial [uncultured Thermomicrobiales bacterium]
WGPSAGTRPGGRSGATCRTRGGATRCRTTRRRRRWGGGR